MSSKSNAYKGGEPLRFAQHLANYGFDMLIREEVKGVSFFIDHEDGVFCVIMPLVSSDGTKVGVVVFYDVKSRLGPDALYSAEPLQTILAEWRKYCRAYVHAEIVGDRVVVLDHDATRNAASSLAKDYNYVPEPVIRKLDEALGTKLTQTFQQSGGVSLHRCNEALLPATCQLKLQTDLKLGLMRLV